MLKKLAVPAVVVVAFALAAAPFPASALTVDFTDDTLFGPGDYTEMYGGLMVSLASTPADALSFTNYDGGDGTGSPPLALDWDGVGVGPPDDEITTGAEAITVTFSEDVWVNGFHFLDLFKAQDPSDDAEVALVYFNDALVASYSFEAAFDFQLSGGYLFAAISPALADMLVFKAASGNDGVGFADYALAAIDITPVPLPAALPLFAGALGVLGLLGRRRRRRASA